MPGNSQHAKSRLEISLGIPPPAGVHGSQTFRVRLGGCRHGRGHGRDPPGGHGASGGRTGPIGPGAGPGDGVLAALRHDRFSRGLVVRPIFPDSSVPDFIMILNLK